VRRVPWRLFAVAGLILAIALWFFFPRETLANSASRIYLQKVIDGDIDWVYDHSFAEEKAQRGFSKEVVQQFYDDFLAELKGATFVKSPTPEINGERWHKQIMRGKVRTTTGKEFSVGLLAYGEDGEMKVGAIESMLYLASDLQEAQGKPKLKLSDIAPWLNEHGMTTIYMAQSDEVLDLSTH
jgi:hypothetical protein